MKAAKKTFPPSPLLLLSALILLFLLLAACGASTPAGNGVTPSPPRRTVTPTPGHPDQVLVYVFQDAAHIWHLRHYDTRTGQYSDIYTTAAGRLEEVQVSADGQWVLFLAELYPAMQAGASTRIQMIRMDGQGLQMLYSVERGSSVGGLEWSPDQRSIAFRENLNVYLLDVASRTTRLVVSGHGDQGLVPRIWLDNTRLYLTPYTGSEVPPLQLYLLDSTTNKVQTILSLPTLGGDFDSSIEAQPATGGQATTIYRTPDQAITALRVASPTCLLFVIHNTGVGNIDMSHNGLWKINSDGTGLTRLTSEASDELTLFPTSTQYVWSSTSRDGSLYVVKLVHMTGPNRPSSLLLGSINGGKPVMIASTDSASTLEIVGWVTLRGGF